MFCPWCEELVDEPVRLGGSPFHPVCLAELRAEQTRIEFEELVDSLFLANALEEEELPESPTKPGDPGTPERIAYYAECVEQGIPIGYSKCTIG